MFLNSALGQTAGRVWQDLLEHPDSTAGEIADRLGVTPRRARRNLESKLVPNHLAEESGQRPSPKGRPAVTYQALDAELDAIAERLGVSDWSERTGERYNRERGGYNAVLRRMGEGGDAASAEPDSGPADDDRRRLEEEAAMRELMGI